MSIKDYIKNWLGEKNEEIGKLIPRPVMGLEPPSPKDKDFLDSADGWVYTCVVAIADEVAKTNIRLYQQRGDKLEEIDTHPLLDLIYKVNNFTTKFDHFWLSQQYLELTGEAPWYLNRPNPSSPPDNMILLRPDKLEVVYDTDNIIGGYKYTIDDYGKNIINIEPQDMVLLRYPAPLSQFRGRGTAEAIPRTIDIDNFSEEWNRKFFYNSARPDAVLETDQTLTDDQVKRLKAQWSEKYQGLQNSSKLAVLEANLKYKPIALSQNDIQFIEQQKFTRDKILGIFRVPKAIVAQTEGVNYASSKSAEYIFARYTIDPKIKRIVEQMNEFLVPQFGDDLILDYDRVVPEDEELKLSKYSNALTNGWLTVNEVRAKEGLEPIDGGDELPQKDPRLVRVKTKTHAKDELKKEFKDTLKDNILNQLREDKKRKEKEKKEIFWKELVRETEQDEVKVAMAVKNLFIKQRAKVLTAMTRKQVSGFDIDEETKAMEKELKPLFYEIAKKYGEQAVTYWNLKHSKDFYSNVNFEEFYGENVDFMKGINETTKKELTKLLKTGIENGLDLDTIKKNIRKLFTKYVSSDVAEGRAYKIARTETQRYANWSTLEAYKQSGVVSKKEWLTALDERTCPRCEALDGTIVGLDTKFRDKIENENVQFPPLHPSCRCTLIPVIGELKSKTIKQEKKVEPDIMPLYKKINKLLEDE